MRLKGGIVAAVLTIITLTATGAGAADWADEANNVDRDAARDLLTAAFPAGYTDGTETYPVICDPTGTVCTHDDGTGFGPIPYGPVWVEECEVIEYDPSYVQITEHYDTTGDGIEDAYQVVPYDVPEGSVVVSDVTEFVAGKQGTVWLTWNLGSGETDRVPFDCKPDEPTTTTTSTTISTTSTIQEPTTTTTVAAVPAGATLPETGANLFLAVTGLVALAAGGALLTGLRYRTR